MTKRVVPHSQCRRMVGLLLLQVHLHPYCPPPHDSLDYRRILQNPSCCADKRRHSAWVPAIEMIFLAHNTWQPDRRPACANAGCHPRPKLCTCPIKKQRVSKREKRLGEDSLRLLSWCHPSGPSGVIQVVLSFCLSVYIHMFVWM